MEDQLTPMMPDRARGSTLSRWFMADTSRGYRSLMDSTPSTLEWGMPMGTRTSVTLAAQGERKKIPICSLGRPVFFMASSRASRAAISMGAFRGSTWSHKSGKRTRISRTTAGQAELMAGFFSFPSPSSWRVRSEWISAPRDTSNTSSNPMAFSPVSTMSMSSRWLNCPYRVGAGRATV